MNCSLVALLVLVSSGVLFPELMFGQDLGNPFLRPGGNKPTPPPVIKQAPPPPAPIPRNPNLEFRGYFKFDDHWHFAIFDKAKNEGVWLKKGESFDEGKVEVVGFDPDANELRLKGGMQLTLKDSEKKVLTVPSGQAVAPKTPAKVIPPPGARSIPPPRRR